MMAMNAHGPGLNCKSVKGWVFGLVFSRLKHKSIE